MCIILVYNVQKYIKNMRQQRGSLTPKYVPAWALADTGRDDIQAGRYYNLINIVIRFLLL